MSNPNPTNPNPLALVNPGGGGDSKQPRRQQQRLKVQYVECKKEECFLLWQIERVCVGDCKHVVKTTTLLKSKCQKKITNKSMLQSSKILAKPEF